MYIAPSAEAIRAYREEFNCGIDEAKVAVKRRALQQAVENAKDWYDLQEVLREMLRDN